MQQPISHEGFAETLELPASSAHDLTITVGHDGDRLVLNVQGEIDTASGTHFSQFLAAAIEQSPSIVLDFSEVGFMDSTGLAALVATCNTARDSGGQVTVRRPSRVTARVLEVSGVDRLLVIEADA